MMFTRFWQNRDGGVAPFLALAAIPLMGFTGAAIDYSRASRRAHGHAGRRSMPRRSACRRPRKA